MEFFPVFFFQLLVNTRLWSFQSYAPNLKGKRKESQSEPLSIYHIFDSKNLWWNYLGSECLRKL